MVNPDPVGHDAQSAAEMLNENSCTHSLAPPKSPSRFSHHYTNKCYLFIRGCGSVLHMRVCGCGSLGGWWSADVRCHRACVSISMVDPEIFRLQQAHVSS